MVSIVKLEHPENVTLIGGASQYWIDKPKPELDVEWSQLLVPQVSGRTLVVGWTPTTTLRMIGEAADELHVLVRGIVDASEIGAALPEAKVWCGDPRGLTQYASDFDTVLCLSDVSRVLPLESETRTWRQVADDVLALAREGATTAMWVENDLGIHRITSTHNPRAERSDDDWDVMRTFDESRPLTLDAVNAAFPGATAYVTWPSHQWSLIANAVTANPAAHAAFAARACVAPLLGPDPVYILSTAARAGRLLEYVSGWLVTENWPTPLEAPMYSSEQGRVVEISQELPEGTRPAFVVFAELTASQNMPAVRRFVADWSATYAEPGKGTAALPLNVVREEGEGYVFTSLAPAPEDKSANDERWEALGEIVGLIRNRNWRHLWPANYTDARVLNHLGIMAGIHTVSPARASQLIPSAPDVHSGFSSLDVPSLVAAIDRNNETINTLRSELALAKNEITRLKDANAGPLRTPMKGARFVKRQVKGLLSR